MTLSNANFDKQITRSCRPTILLLVVSMSKKTVSKSQLWSQNLEEQKIGSGDTAWKLGDRSCLSRHNLQRPWWAPVPVVRIQSVFTPSQYSVWWTRENTCFWNKPRTCYSQYTPVSLLLLSMCWILILDTAILQCRPTFDKMPSAADAAAGVFIVEMARFNHDNNDCLSAQNDCILSPRYDTTLHQHKYVYQQPRRFLALDSSG